MDIHYSFNSVTAARNAGCAFNLPSCVNFALVCLSSGRYQVRLACLNTAPITNLRAYVTAQTYYFMNIPYSLNSLQWRLAPNTRLVNVWIRGVLLMTVIIHQVSILLPYLRHHTDKPATICHSKSLLWWRPKWIEVRRNVVFLLPVLTWKSNLIITLSFCYHC